MKIERYSYNQKNSHVCHADSEWGGVIWEEVFRVKGFFRDVTFEIGKYRKGLGVRIWSGNSVPKRFLIKKAVEAI